MFALRLFLSLLLLFFINNCASQERILHDHGFWVGYITQAKISDKFSWWNDGHYMAGSFLVLRTGISYHIEKPYRMSFTAGYAKGSLVADLESPKFRTEHRPWVQSTLSYKSPRFDFFHRLRIEARFRQKIYLRTLLDEFNFNHRIRYMIQVRYPFGPVQSQQYYAVMSNEILFDQGNEIAKQFRLNQNRLSFGLGRRVNSVRLQLEYVNILFPPPEGRSWKMSHVARLITFWNFTLKKKSENQLKL
jgi:hypothetical protein